jgi:hypothetical protein
MKRLPALPEKVRTEWKPMTRLPSSVKPATPEECKGKDWIHDWEVEDKAELDLDEVFFYRGKARAVGGNRTRVNTLAVWRSKVIAYTCGEIMRSFAEPGDPYHAHRQLAIIEMEHDLAKHLRSSLGRTIVKALGDLEKKKHAALPTTKLAALRRRIASMESVLAELREEEATLVAADLAAPHARPTIKV